MSEDIIKANYEDTSLPNLRQIINNFNDDFPIVLFPVRLETRFMKVEKTVEFNRIDILSVEDAILDARFRIYNNSSGQLYSIDKIKIGYRGISSSLTTVEKEIKKLTQISSKYRVILSKRQMQIISAIEKLKDNYKSGHVGDIRTNRYKYYLSRSLTGWQNRLKVSLDKSLKNVRIDVNGVEKALNCIGSLHDILKNMNTLPYSVAKMSKRQSLYQQLDKYITRINRVTKEAKTTLSGISSSTLKQINQLKKSLQSIEGLSKILESKTASIYSKNKRKLYCNLIHSIKNDISVSIIKPFREVIVTNIEYLSEYNAISIEDYCYQLYEINYQLRCVENDIILKKHINIHEDDLVIKELDSFFEKSSRPVDCNYKDIELFRQLLEKFLGYVNNLEKKIKKELNRSNNSEKKIIHNVYEKIILIHQNVISQKNKLMKPVTTKLIYSNAQRYKKLVNEIKSFQNDLKISNKKEIKFEIQKKFAKVENLRKNLFKDISVLPLSKQNHLENAVTKLNTLFSKKMSDLDEPERHLNNLMNKVERKIPRTLIKDIDSDNINDLPVVIATEEVQQLWVRIYPDDICIQALEEKLTKEEFKSGKEYWKQAIETDDENLLKGAWRMLCSSYGTQRAAWIAKISKPNTKNLDNDLRLSIRKLLSALKESEKLLREIERLKLSQFVLFQNKLTRCISLLEEFKDISIKIQLTPIIIKNIQNNLTVLSKRINSVERVLKTNTNESNLILNQIGREFEYLKNIIQSIANNVDAINSNYGYRGNANNIEFPNIKTKEKSWEKPPQTNIMPDNFAVLTIRNNAFRHIVIGKKVEIPLNVGFDPGKSDFFSYNENGDLIIDDSIKWMFDFNEAEKKGMAIKVPLNVDDIENGFDKIIVVGIKENSEKDSTKKLEGLLKNHHYSGNGMSILSVGTPTNNTEKVSGFSSEDEGFEKSYTTECCGNLFDENNNNPHTKSDGQRLVAALGIKPEIFQNIHNSNEKSISNAINLHNILWPGTVGVYMEDILETFFRKDTINRTRDFFENSVCGRGIIPSLRIGKQPYGILPVTRFTKIIDVNINDVEEIPLSTIFSELNDSQLEKRFDQLFKLILHRIYGIYQNIVRNSVPYIGKVISTDPQQHFLDILGLHGTTAESYYRFSMNCALHAGIFKEEVNDVEFEQKFNHLDEILDIFKDIMEKAYSWQFMDILKTGVPVVDNKDKITALNKKLSKSRLYCSRSLTLKAPLVGVLIEPDIANPLNTRDQKDPLKKYIDWLIESDLYKILKNVSGEDEDLPPSSSLLFLLLRMSLLLECRTSAFNILQHEKLIDEEIWKKAGSSAYYKTFSPYFDHPTYITKWNFLFHSLKYLDGLFKNEFDPNSPFYNANRSNSMAIYFGSNTNNEFLSPVNKYKEKLGFIADESIENLEYMLKEHFDICSYRLDAWISGFANKILTGMREKNSTGIYIGAYGWLENVRKGSELEKADDAPPELLPNDSSSILRDPENRGFIHAPTLDHAVAACILHAGYLGSKDIVSRKNSLAVNLSSRRIRKAIFLLEGVKNGQELGHLLGYQFERGLHENYLDLGIELDKCIHDFRKRYSETNSGNASGNENSYQYSVIDGQALIDEIMDHISHLSSDDCRTVYEILYDEGHYSNCPAWLKKLADNSNEKLKCIIREIDRIADAEDALGDLVLSECVYQISRGNHERAAAVMASLAEGKEIPKIQIAQTVRNGFIVTHKVVIDIKPISSFNISPLSDRVNDQERSIHIQDAKPEGWKNIQLTPKAFAEPTLNNWIGEVIGAADKIKVLYMVDGQISDISLAELDLQPIDYLYEIDIEKESNSNAFHKRLKYMIHQIKNIPSDKVVDIIMENAANQTSPDTIYLADFYSLIEPIQEIIKSCRSLLPDDIPISKTDTKDENLNNSILIDELDIRAKDILSRINELLESVEPLDLNSIYKNAQDINSLPDIQTQNIIIKFLYNASFYSGGDTLPKAMDDNDSVIEILESAVTVQSDLKNKSNNVERLVAKLTTLFDKEKIAETYTEIFKIVYDKSFNIIFHFENKYKNELHTLYTNKEKLLRNAKAQALDSWLHGISMVRNKMTAIENASFYSKIYQKNTFPFMCPIQVEYKEDDYWMGIEYPEEFVPYEDKTSYILLDGKEICSANENAAGLLIDQWVELIPDKKNTTGISFHFNRPGVEAPQSLLLAVPHEKRGNWRWDDLVFTILDTMELYKIRAVEPDQINNSSLSQLLPAIMAEVVPPQLEGTDDDPLGVQAVCDFGDNNPLQTVGN